MQINQPTGTPLSSNSNCVWEISIHLAGTEGWSVRFVEEEDSLTGLGRAVQHACEDIARFDRHPIQDRGRTSVGISKHADWNYERDTYKRAKSTIAHYKGIKAKDPAQEIADFMGW